MWKGKEGIKTNTIFWELRFSNKGLALEGRNVLLVARICDVF